MWFCLSDLSPVQSLALTADWNQSSLAFVYLQVGWFFIYLIDIFVDIFVSYVCRASENASSGRASCCGRCEPSWCRSPGCCSDSCDSPGRRLCRRRCCPCTCRPCSACPCWAGSRWTDGRIARERTWRSARSLRPEKHKRGGRSDRFPSVKSRPAIFDQRVRPLKPDTCQAASHSRPSLGRFSLRGRLRPAREGLSCGP